MAAALLAARARSSGRLGELVLGVGSAGFLRSGEPATPEAVATMAERGLDIGDHRSRVVSPAMVRAADLVVTMERAHVRRLHLEVPEAASRVHTLGAVVADLVGAPGATLGERLQALHRERPPSALLGNGSDEVADPFGRSRRVYRRTAERLDALVVELIAALSRGPE